MELKAIHKIPFCVDTFSVNRSQRRYRCNAINEAASNGGSTTNAVATDGTYNSYEFDHDLGQQVDNSQAVLANLMSAYESGDLSDVTLAVSAREYHVHKLMLCVSSEVFTCLLSSGNWAESGQARIVLQEEPECVAVFDSFLRYIYTGSIHLNHYRVLPTLMLADKYNVTHLQRVCLDYMCSHLVTLVVHNHTISWLRYGLIAGHRRLSMVCTQFARSNFLKVTSTDDYLSADLHTVSELVKQSDLVVPDEFSVFLSVTRWLRYNKPHQFFSAISPSSQSLNSLRRYSIPSLPCSSSAHSGLTESVDRKESVISSQGFRKARSCVSEGSVEEPYEGLNASRHSLCGSMREADTMKTSDSKSSCMFDSDSTNSSYNCIVDASRDSATEESRREVILDSSTQMALDMLKLVRFSMMPPSHVRLALLDPCLACIPRDYLITFIPDLLQLTINNSAHRLRIKHRHNMRNYCHEPWSATITVENFSTMTAQDVKSMSFSSPADSAFVTANEECQERALQSAAAKSKLNNPSSSTGNSSSSGNSGGSGNSTSTKVKAGNSSSSTGNSTGTVNSTSDCCCESCDGAVSLWDWQAVLHPKGVHFHKSILRGWWRNLEVTGAVFNSVRLVLSAVQPVAGGPAERRLVDVAVLVTGVQDDVEFVKRVVEKRCLFDEQITSCHIDHIVAFDELNRPDSEYLSGADANTFKIAVIVKPVKE